MKFTVMEVLVPKFEERLAKFTKKFNKYGNGVITYTKSEPYIALNSNRKNVSFVDIDVEGSYRVGEYEFVAVLEYSEEAGKNLVKKSSDTADIPKEFISRNECDHCHSHRFRKNTVLLRNTSTNEYVQVGNRCVRDYIGVDVADYAAFFSIFDNLADYLDAISHSNSVRCEEFFLTQKVLEQTCAEVNHRGYVSKATIDKWWDEHYVEDYEWLGIYCPYTKTTTRIFYMFNEVRGNDNKLIEPEYELTEEDKEFAIKVREFVKNLEDSDYNRNLQILLASEYVNNDNLGMLVSSVGYYIREQKKLEEANKPAEEKSEFIGEVGDKIEITAKPELVRTVETEYGTMRIYKFLQGKDELIWKTSKVIDTTKELVIKGTIKNHNEYKGNKSTELTRCRVTG